MAISIKARGARASRRVEGVLTTFVATLAFAAACGGNKGQSSTGFGGGGAHATASATSSSSGDIGFGGFGGFGGPGGMNHGPFTDFPATPILDTPMGGAAPPANSGDLFGPAGSGDASTGPCLVEPEPGTLFPNNWTRPRFRWVAASGQNLFELRIKAASNETHELVVYTTASQWTMPKDMWASLSSHLTDVPLTVSIRGATLSGDALMGSPGVGTSGDVTIAPASAAGAIVYWRTVEATDTGELKGFSAGDESVVLALAASQVQVQPGGTKVTCLGCHASTPDGNFAAFKTLHNTSGGALASVQATSVGSPPSFWTTSSINAMNTFDFGIPSFSKAHWQTGDRTLLTSFGNDSAAQVAWFDLEATSSAKGTGYDILPRTGDSNGAIMPTFSHDGKTIVYTSTNASTSGRPISDPADLYVMPYANRMGGAATPIAGASDPNYNEYYPALSPDDKLLAFNRVGKGVNMYDEPTAEVFVVPLGGGTPTRIAANDPLACSGQKSPGITNSWPKWAPQASHVGDRTFYWLAFSSRRMGGNPQLYMTAVVVKGTEIQTYPALYIWAQPPGESNHTPAWDVFQIPSPPPIQ